MSTSVKQKCKGTPAERERERDAINHKEIITCFAFRSSLWSRNVFLAVTITAHSGNIGHRSAEGLLSEAVAMRTKAERAKTLLKARLAAVSRGCKRSGIVGCEARPASAAGGDGSQSPSTHGRSRWGGVDHGTAVPDRKEMLPFRLGTIFSRAAGGEEERAKQSLGAVKASLEESPPIREPQQRQLEQKLALVDGPREPSPEQERDAGHSPRNRDRQRPDLEQEQPKKLEKQRQGEEVELELVKKEMERQRRNFEVERQVLERKRQESSLAAQSAENRAGELKAAWQALAEKVLSLAGRNADLERVSE